MTPPLVSIITVVYNGADTLERTIQSVVRQTYPNLEYIIVDGGSQDGTLEIIHSYQKQISCWSSEPDEGLYHAMNKGIAMATGDYFWFINAGDEIADATVVAKIFEEGSYADVYYGDTLVVDSFGKEIGLRRLSPPANLTWRDFKRGMLVSHQSFIASRRVATNFNTQYRFSADYDWCIKALKAAREVRNTRLIMSRFLEGGLTRHNILPGLKERFGMMVKYFGVWATVWAHVGIAFRFFRFLIWHRRF